MDESAASNLIEVSDHEVLVPVSDMGDEEVKVYKKRFFMLLLFMILSASNALQWVQYCIISDVVVSYYGVSNDAVNWTSMIYMLTYIVLIFPGSWFLDKYGLKTSILIGALGNCLGAWIKVAGTHPDSFWILFIGQAIVASSQVFILGIPPPLAAVWFGSDEVSTACAAGVMGNLVGVGLGFVLPPWLVQQGTPDKVAGDLMKMSLMSSCVNTIALALIVIFFKEKPPKPPSVSQARASKSHKTDYLADLRKLAKNRGFILMLTVYALTLGVFNTSSTLLNQVVLKYYPKAAKEVGIIGLINVLAGMLGSVVCGFILDKYHHYKVTTAFICFFSFFGMMAFTYSLLYTLWSLFIVSAILGFFLTGFIPVGLEFGVELTYPAPESTTSGLLNLVVQIGGILMILGASKVITVLGVFWLNIILAVILLISACLTVFIKEDLRRHKSQITGHVNEVVVEDEDGSSEIGAI